MRMIQKCSPDTDEVPDARVHVVGLPRGDDLPPDGRDEDAADLAGALDVADAESDGGGVAQEGVRARRRRDDGDEGQLRLRIGHQPSRDVALPVDT